MRRGLLHQGWYWVLVFLGTTLTARPALGCYTWFQVGVMWPLCSSCSKRAYATGFAAVLNCALNIHSGFCTLIAAACRPACCCKYIICGGSNWQDVPVFTHCISWSTACPMCVICRIYVVRNWCELQKLNSIYMYHSCIKIMWRCAVMCSCFFKQSVK